jgi:hypothetical protein
VLVLVVLVLVDYLFLIRAEHGDVVMGVVC